MSPRTSKQFEEIREEKRNLIMDTALEHFANQGYYATTINHIAKHAGISKGLMYNYFESKEALLEAILQKSVIEIYKYLDIDEDGSLSEAEFEFFVRKISVVLYEKKSFWRLFFQLLMQNEVRENFSVLSSDPLIKMEFFNDNKNFMDRRKQPWESTWCFGKWTTLRFLLAPKNVGLDGVSWLIWLRKT